jgi:hypothetical protein
MTESIAFVVNGRSMTLTRTAVTAAMDGVEAEPIRSHQVSIDGRAYPVKQVFGQATGLDRLDFTSAVARRHLARLGFEVSRS